MHPLLEACCVTGASLGQPLGVVMLGAEAQRMARDTAGRADLQSSLAAHLRAVNAKLDPHERLCCIAVVSAPWTVESGLVTPTLKVRRSRIDATYSIHYAAWSRTHQPVVWA
jgi:long-chain acyl-CoA synthetase